VVQPGDTLYRLALNTGTSVSQIMLANCLDSTWILAGQLLWLPVLPPPTATIPSIPTPTTPYTPEVTITPSVIPKPELWLDLELNGVTYDAPLWIIRMTVIVYNRGTGSSEPGVSGDVFYSYGLGKSITSQQVEWSIREAVQPGGAAASRVMIQIDDPERYWAGTNVSTHAMMGNMGSTIVRVPLPQASKSPAQSDVLDTPYVTPVPFQLIIPPGQ
jgi:LysM repeat protein